VIIRISEAKDIPKGQKNLRTQTVMMEINNEKRHPTSGLTVTGLEGLLSIDLACYLM
jgi:hypothetical protein